jgi:hypothetical protein
MQRRSVTRSVRVYVSTAMQTDTKASAVTCQQSRWALASSGQPIRSEMDTLTSNMSLHIKYSLRDTRLL